MTVGIKYLLASTISDISLASQPNLSYTTSDRGEGRLALMKKEAIEQSAKLSTH